ncbi:MAG TPA: nuclear transport factor 2 family protein [Acidobacteriaceae bacterium]|jgi:hypothetical protein|nr:nuclear transport factor 2 family protein [Acidobacteriaceae bacterium]
MEPLAAELRALEERLLDPDVRRDRAAVASLLAVEFVEFGSSGRVYDKAAILDMLAAETPQRIELADFVARPVAPDAVLVTWRATRSDGPPHPGAASLRSSVWIRREDRWQMIFHQGTHIPGDDP